MKHDIAIAATKVKKRVHTAGKPGNSTPLDVEASRFGIGILLYGAIFIGAGGLICLFSGLIKSGGPFSLVKGWLAALLGG